MTVTLPPDQLGELASAMAAAVLKGLAGGEGILTINITVRVELDVPAGLNLLFMRLAADPDSAQQSNSPPNGTKGAPVSTTPRPNSSRPPSTAGDGAQDLRDRLQAFIARTGHSLNHVAEAAHLAWDTVRAALRGDPITLETQEKLRVYLELAEPVVPDEGGGHERAAAGDQAAEPPDEDVPDDIRQQLREYLVEHDVSIAATARKLGFCEQAVRKWVAGTTEPSDAGRKAIAALLAGEEPRSECPAMAFDPNDDPEVIGNLPRQPDPRHAAAYLQKSVSAWLKAHNLNHDQAAARLGIRRHQLLHVLAPPGGPEQMHPPVQALIEVVVAGIPELQQDLPALLAARRMFERATAA